MIGDFMTVAITTRANERADNFIIKNSKFKNNTQEEYINYLSQTLNIMIDDFGKLLKKSNKNCSALFKP